MAISADGDTFVEAIEKALAIAEAEAEKKQLKAEYEVIVVVYPKSSKGPIEGRPHNVKPYVVELRP